jgi:DNA-binding CsgD family transcriptional regulator/tetratricopeptide (TPR) repeat protein
VHGALAAATDVESDPDRRAWHRARATPGPDEDVATELERSAARARSRGGLAATAAFLERAAELTEDPARRAQRALTAAEVTCEAGSFDRALALLATAEAQPLDDIQRCRLLLLRGRIAFAQRRTTDVWPLLREAARSAEVADPTLARLAYLEAFHAALHDGRFAPDGVAEVSQAALACPTPPAPQRPRDLLLVGLATRVTAGYAVGAPLLKDALAAFRREDDLALEDAHWVFLASRVASDLWDDGAHLDLSTRELRRARQTGALAAIPTLLEVRLSSHLLAGELTQAVSAVDEARAAREATGIHTHSGCELLLVALQGREAEATRMIEHAAHAFEAHRDGLGVATVEYAAAILYNGLGRYKEALAAVGEAGERPYEIGEAMRAVAELVEAAARSGDDRRARQALERLAEISRASGTTWVHAVEARSRALVSEGAVAEELYRTSVEMLSGTRLQPELARAQLHYGEWLRREHRRVDARAQLRASHAMFETMGMEAFAERARRELLATGEKVRKRTAETRSDLTPQEVQIAQLARDGRSNPEIAAQLFLSPRTVEWHLRKVFGKLGIGSRKELDAVLRTQTPEPQRA